MNEKLIKKAKHIRNVGIIATIFLSLFLIISLFIFYGTLFSQLNTSSLIGNYSPLLLLGDDYFVMTICILTFIAFIVGIVNFVYTIKIMTTQWNNPQLDSSDKILWGLLSIFLLGPISNIIFGSKALKVLRSNNAQATETKEGEKKLNVVLEDEEW